MISVLIRDLAFSEMEIPRLVHHSGLVKDSRLMRFSIRTLEHPLDRIKMQNACKQIESICGLRYAPYKG